MPKKAYDVAVIGGGIVGLATARALLLARRISLVVLEAENRLGTHQTGHNSGVIHSGLYYRPGSLKASNCSIGREALYRFCAEYGVPHERCGKVVVATDAAQLAMLTDLERRGRANGLQGLLRLSSDELREYEPHVSGVAALFVPDTGIVDFSLVAASLGQQSLQRGAEILTGARVTRIERRASSFILTSQAGEIECRNLVNCAGLQADRVAELCGLPIQIRIVPFRGEYFALRPGSQRLVRNLIYPVPDPRFPFLGVHFTRMIHGGIEVGPNALLAFKREGYSRWSFSLRDTLACLTYGGFQRLAGRYWRTGVREWYRAMNKKALVRDLQKLVPELQAQDLEPHGSGVRAQAVSPAGQILDDFEIHEAERMLHVLNAPSPAATASLSIGETLADRAGRNFDLPDRSH